MFNTTGSRGGKKRAPIPLIGNIAGNSSSSLIDMRVNGISQFNMSNVGQITLPPGSASLPMFAFDDTSWGSGKAGMYYVAAQIRLVNGSGSPTFASDHTSTYASRIGIGGLAAAASAFLGSDGGNLLALKNGANAQAIRIYNTEDFNTPPINYERIAIDWTTTPNTATIAMQAGGTGSARSITITSSVNSTTALNLVAGSLQIAFNTTSNALSFNPGGSQAFFGGNINGSAGVSVSNWTGISGTFPGVIGIANSNAATGSGGYINWGGEARTVSDFSKTDAALADITGLSSSISIGSSVLGTVRAYSFRGWFPCTMGSSAGGIKFAVTCTSTTVTSIIYNGYALNNGTVQGSSIQATAIGTAVAVSTGPATALSAYISGTIRVASSGLLKFQFAQVSSNATASVISSGAYVWVNDMP